MEITSKSNCEEATILNLRNRIAKLEKENKQLKNQNTELILHNEIKIVEDNNTQEADPSMIDEYEEEYLAGCENEEMFKAMANAYANLSLQ